MRVDPENPDLLHLQMWAYIIAVRKIGATLLYMPCIKYKHSPVVEQISKALLPGVMIYAQYQRYIHSQ